MQDLQTITAAISSLEKNLSVTIKTLETISTAVQQLQQEQKKSQSIEVTAQKFVDFFSDELSKNISGGKLFVAKLNYIRTNYDRLCYQSLTPLYAELVNKPNEGWAQRRQLLLTASAIWRYTFHGRDYTLKSQIEAAMECGDCGKFVRPMVERMIQEKIWK
jgi:hypothetical protein